MAKSKKETIKQESVVTPVETINSFKGFDNKLQCRDFQYEIGKTYHHEGSVKACGSGFHACEYPLDVFGYYVPSQSRFATVVQSGDLNREEDGDSKVASRSITVKAEIDIPFLVKASIEYTTSKCEPLDTKSPAFSDKDRGQASATGYKSASSATGYKSASSATGDQSASSATGYKSASSATGDQSASSATGYKSASSATGDQSASSATGYKSASSATGDQSASSATGDQSASSATGYKSASSATGDQSASSATGYKSASSATGDQSASSATGYKSASSATGDQSASSATGDQSASSATGYKSASSATGDQSASSATGDQSASSATGNYSASTTTGYYSESQIIEKEDCFGVAVGVGYQNKARAPKGSAIVLAFRGDEGEIIHIRASKVGDNGVKANTWYQLDAEGQFVEFKD